MENNIIRKYPTIKDERVYKDRYNKDDFEKYKEITKSMENAIKEIKRRRKIQEKYNKEHNITPKTIIKKIQEWPFLSKEKEVLAEFGVVHDIKLLEKEMKEAAKKYNVKRFVYISSSMVYGNFINSVDENHPTNPTNLYGVLKLTGESLIKDYCRNTNIQYNIIRPSAVYGKRDIKNRVVNKFILAAINGTPLKVCGVNEKLDFTYVDDTVNGIVLATLNNEHFDKIYNITRAVSHTILDAAKIIVNIVGKGEIKIENKHTDYPSRSSLIINKATTELGYVPKTDIKEGFQKCYEWIKNTIY